MLAKIGKIIAINVVALLFLFPFLFLLMNTFKGKMEILKNPLAFPTEWSLDNYIEAFEEMNYINSITNSIIITVIGVIVLNIFGAMMAFYLARFKTKANSIIYLVMTATMLIPFQTLMIPFVSIYGNLGMLNNRWILIYFYLGFGISLSTFIYHGFVNKLSVSLDESASIEGASKFAIFWKIIFPQLKPITATLTVLNVLWLWNDYLLPSLVLVNKDRTLPLNTYSFFGKYTSEYGLAMSGLVLSILPVIVFYLFMQKHIVSGITEGAIK
ncbi:sugar ABC transporter permease [Candidatus Epulonipiscium fishelsonii]|uniref:Sugar ABC transporter permease n=1 Tax=Candidatus Epulonipiscium fishelsonii TaxID=77094 RepID=A0ACC8XEM0_9FIRM|nr:sugar ABC transporter permease [Epulopiscium sp. SCG-B11WGA-EpuloA1]ONI43237.1 sugar ABC transporter permease [Epulopiscium sp. SCG-B05WGA-EpuloA1]